MSTAWVRTTMACLLAVVLYFLCLWLIFPGYFSPLVPHHSDMYIPAGLLNRSVAEVLTFPRPVANLFLRTIGMFGVQGSILVVVLVVLGGAVATAFVAKSTPSLFAIALYCIMLFAHPQFYFHHRHDVPAAVTYLLLLAALWTSQKWLRDRSRRALVLYLLVILTLGLTKETYYISALVLVGGIGMVLNRQQWRSVVTLVAGTVGIELVAFLFNAARYRHFLSSSTTAGQPYAASLNPFSLLPTLGAYLRELASPLAVILVAVAVAAIWKARDKLLVAGTFIVAGIAALIPHAALPNHMEAQYAWVAAPLLFAPVLLVPSSSKVHLTAIAAVLVVWIEGNRPMYQATPQQWLITQEKANASILQALPSIRQTAGRQVLVSGLRASYHPWLSTDFIRHYFGSAHSWTFLVPRNGVQRSDGTVALKWPAAVKANGFDTAVLFERDGRLKKILVGRELEAANPDVLLVPALDTHLRIIQTEPGNFMSLLSAGIEYLEGGWPERALSYLERAAAADARNPYPAFFLGQAMEAQGNRAAARARYEQAIALDAPPGNPAFRQALMQLRSK